MDMQNINSLLKNLDQNQLREINQFLNSKQGVNIKNKINKTDKERLIRELSSLNPNLVSSKLKGLSQADILKILNNL